MRTASLQLCLLSIISSLKGPAARFSILARIDKPIIKQGDKKPILDEVVISGYISEDVWLITHTITSEYRWKIGRWEKFPIKATATATLLDKAWEPSPVNAKPSTSTLPIQPFGEKLSFGFRISFVVGVLQKNPTATLTLYLESSTLVNYCISDDSSKDDNAGNSLDYLEVKPLEDQKSFYFMQATISYGSETSVEQIVFFDFTKLSTTIPKHVFHVLFPRSSGSEVSEGSIKCEDFVKHPLSKIILREDDHHTYEFSERNGDLSKTTCSLSFAYNLDIHQDTWILGLSFAHTHNIKFKMFEENGKDVLKFGVQKINRK